MGALQQLLQIACDTLVYWGTFLYFWLGQQPISKLEVFGEQRLPLCHVYVLAKTLQLWNAPHYRAASFAEDQRANLKNVAVPGTGIPLSVFCYNKATALFFITVINPVISLAAAVYCYYSKEQPSDDASTSQHASIAASYRQLLLFPDHWFAIWRHNCMVVGYHALVTGSSSYAMEAKGTFLLEGQRLGLPVSPFYSDATVFVKHVSIEGGMGIHVFRNFAQGGEWVIQRALSNSANLSRMLPPGAPLSTLRIVTASTAWLDQQGSSEPSSRPYTVASYSALKRRSAADSSEQSGRQEGWLNGTTLSSSNGSQTSKRLTPDLPLSAGVVQQDRSPITQPLSRSSAGEARQINGVATIAQAGHSSDVQAEQLFDGQVQVVTAVWRAGLAGKDTDHSSICFPVDPQTGLLSRGVSSNHWYKLGLKWLGRLDWSTAGRGWVDHPDSHVTVAGESIPDMQKIMRTIMHAHMVATPDVPLVGWDVALTPEGVYLLEMNLSCNLFNGAFASADYYLNMFRHFETLESLEATGRHCGKQP